MCTCLYNIYINGIDCYFMFMWHCIVNNYQICVLFYTFCFVFLLWAFNVYNICKIETSYIYLTCFLIGDLKGEWFQIWYQYHVCICKLSWYENIYRNKMHRSFFNCLISVVFHLARIITLILYRQIKFRHWVIR